MTAKEYLNQAYRIDQRINSKLEQVASLRDLLTRTSSTLSDMPRNPNKGASKTEDIIVKIVDIENEIKEDIDKLLTLKQGIMQTIKSVEPVEYQMLLELRYLCFKTWEEIAVELGYSIQHTYRIRDKAIACVVVPKNDR